MVGSSVSWLVPAIATAVRRATHRAMNALHFMEYNR